MPGKDATPTVNITPNPLLGRLMSIQSVDLERVESPVVLLRSRRQHGRRELRDARRMKEAAHAIEGLSYDLEIYGFTKGQFSLLDLIIACLDITGPAIFTLSTWTANRNEIATLGELAEAGKILSVRFLLDFTLARRDPEAAHAIRSRFGLESVRIAQNHAKFAIFENKAWRLVLRTSMNLNMNPRFEDFSLAHDPPLADFLSTILGEVWSRQPKSLLDERPKTIKRFFAEKM